MQAARGVNGDFHLTILWEATGLWGKEESHEHDHGHPMKNKHRSLQEERIGDVTDVTSRAFSCHPRVSSCLLV